MTNQDHVDSEESRRSRQRAIEAYESARESATDTLGEAPLLALAGGLAAGALIAALLPRTGAEIAARSARPRGGSRTAHEGGVRARREDTGTQRLDELGMSREKSEQTIRSLLEGLTDAAQGYGQCRVRCRPQQERRSRVNALGEVMSKLHPVFGGQGQGSARLSISIMDAVEVVGVYDSYAAAEDAWRGDAQRTVDDAEMKYVVVHLHRLFEPESRRISRPSQPAQA